MVNVGRPAPGTVAIDVNHVGHGQRREDGAREGRDRRQPCGAWSTSGGRRAGGARSASTMWGMVNVGRTARGRGAIGVNHVGMVNAGRPTRGKPPSTFSPL